MKDSEKIETDFVGVPIKVSGEIQGHIKFRGRGPRNGPLLPVRHLCQLSLNRKAPHL